LLERCYLDSRPDGKSILACSGCHWETCPERGLCAPSPTPQPHGAKAEFGTLPQPAEDELDELDHILWDMNNATGVYSDDHVLVAEAKAAILAWRTRLCEQAVLEGRKRDRGKLLGLARMSNGQYVVATSDIKSYYAQLDTARGKQHKTGGEDDAGS